MAAFARFCFIFLVLSIGTAVSMYPKSHYDDLTDIYRYLQHTFSDQVTVVNTIGTTPEGRSILGVKVHLDNDLNTASNRTVILTAGLHGNNAMASKIATELITNLTHSNFFSDEDRLLVKSFQWLIVPYANPDGYAYVRNTSQINWQKTRRPHRNGCFGVDLDHNFLGYWRKTTNDTCSNVYPGRRAYSEPETRALGSFFGIKEHNPVLYVSLREHANPKIIYPYGYQEAGARNHQDLKDICEVGRRAVASTLNITCHQLSAYHNKTVFGNEIDFAYDTLHVPHVFIYELLPSTSITVAGRHNDIVHNEQHFTKALLAMLRKANETDANADFNEELKPKVGVVPTFSPQNIIYV